MYNNYKMKRKEENNNVSCPICGEKLSNQVEMYKHIANKHENITQILLSLKDNIDDWEYFLSMLNWADDNVKTERWYNS